MNEEQQVSLFDLQIDDAGAGFLKETAKWAKFISIIFALCVLIMLLAFSFAGPAIMTAFNRVGYTGGLFNAAGSVIIILVIIFAAVFAFLTYTLFTFSQQTKKAVEFQDQAALEKGIASLKNYFLIGGIIAVLGIIGSLIQFFN